MNGIQQGVQGGNALRPPVQRGEIDWTMWFEIPGGENPVKWKPVVDMVRERLETRNIDSSGFSNAEISKLFPSFFEVRQHSQQFAPGNG